MIWQRYISDLIHGAVVVLVCVFATIYGIFIHDHSDNVWIIYGSSIAFAAGRSGATMIGGVRRNGNNHLPSPAVVTSPATAVEAVAPGTAVAGGAPPSERRYDG